jgi:hypothetical protein
LSPQQRSIFKPCWKQQSTPIGRGGGTNLFGRLPAPKLALVNGPVGVEHFRR